MLRKLDDAILDFISKHENDDLSSLALQSQKYPNLDVLLAIQQIKGRQKIKLKVPEWYHNKAIYYPKKVSLEQSSSEPTALYKASLIENSSLTDLTGGMGVDAYFFSHTCSHVHYIEKNTELSEISQHNFSVLNAQNVSVHAHAAEDYLKTHETTPTDVYFLDPARRDGQNKKLVLLEDCQPQLSVILPEIIKRKARLLVKTSPLLDIKSVANKYPQLTSVHVVAVNNECKELLFDFDPEHTHKGVAIMAINIKPKQKNEKFYFHLAEELHQSIPIAPPERFLYEPNAAIMKAGGFKSIAKAHALSKLHAHTHLYTGHDIIAEFPGRVFEIIGTYKADRKQLQKALNSDKANITVRNYPSSVAALRKKLKLKEGGDHYLFACTLHDDSKVILACRKL